VPLALRRVIERGLARDPSARWRDMDALLAALARATTPWRRLWLAAPLAGALGLVVLAVRDGPSDCAADADALDATWSAARRAQIEGSLAAIDRHYAADVAQRVGARLDDHAQRVRAAMMESCAAGGAAAEPGRRRRHACLHERSDAMAALLAELAKADAAALDRAIDAVAELPRP
jgi:hypothetical protein